MAPQALSVQPNLINVFEGVIGSVRQLVVNARDLHSFLQVGKVFAAWIQERIGKYEFIENEDFTVFSKSGKNPKGGRSSIEYHLALDMAKELSMVENNDKGREARRYFIAMEKKALAIAPVVEQCIEYITRRQYIELSKTIRNISSLFGCRQKAAWWVWAELRQLSGGEPVNKMPAKFYDVAQQRLKDIHIRCMEFKDLIRETENAFFRQNANLVPVEMQALLDQST